MNCVALSEIKYYTFNKCLKFSRFPLRRIRVECIIPLRLRGVFFFYSRETCTIALKKKKKGKNCEITYNTIIVSVWCTRPSAGCGNNYDHKKKKKNGIADTAVVRHRWRNFRPSKAICDERGRENEKKKKTRYRQTTP